MDKQSFLNALRQGLSDLPAEDVQRHIEYYSEMIDDRAEDGLTETEAVAAMGDPRQIANQILAEAGVSQNKRQPLPVWAIVLLILGAPIWASLLVAAFSVIISVYATLWATVIALYAVPITLGATAFASLVLGIVRLTAGDFPLAAAFSGTALTCAGLCMFAFCLCNLAAKGVVFLSKWIVKAIIKLFTRKEKAS